MTFQELFQPNLSLAIAWIAFYVVVMTVLGVLNVRSKPTFERRHGFNSKAYFVGVVLVLPFYAIAAYFVLPALVLLLALTALIVGLNLIGGSL